MTFALCIKTGDGLVIAADSTTSSMGALESGAMVVTNLFRNANKVFNLIRGYPVGLCTAGMATFGGHSIEFLLKELRIRMMDPHQGNWYVDPATLRVQDVAEKVHRYFHDELYIPNQAEIGNGHAMFYVAGIDADLSMGCVYRLDVPALPGQSATMESVASSQPAGFVMDGQIEPVHRLFKGYSMTTPDLLVQHFGLPPEQKIEAVAKLNLMEQPMVSAQMPIQDAIDLAEFLVSVAVKWTRFLPGMETVGGQIDIAALTKHEGFEWIRRKHYYSPELNPVNPHAW